MTGCAATCVIGVDPGATTGVCLLQVTSPEPWSSVSPVPYITERLVFGCNSAAVYGLVEHLIECNQGPARIVAAGEKFVPGRGAGARSGGASQAQMVIGELQALPVEWTWRTPVAVKHWAIDDRLKKAGLLDLTAKMIDARDAARHALFAACHDAGLPDPLSRKAVRAVPLDLKEL